ncbi:hypothetical protein FB451DRAFT_1273361 [Mycena latifolia]|nr:hypothetical protein FB451DRAFT_1273361 [Mycena latifolia]
MFIRPTLLLSAFSVTSSLAAIALYGQCGGDDLVWPDTCAEGLTCQYVNFWYSQCLTPLPAATTAASDESASTDTPSARRSVRFPLADA